MEGGCVVWGDGLWCVVWGDGVRCVVWAMVCEGGGVSGCVSMHSNQTLVLIFTSKTHGCTPIQPTHKQSTHPLYITNAGCGGQVETRFLANTRSRGCYLACLSGVLCLLCVWLLVMCVWLLVMCVCGVTVLYTWWIQPQHDIPQQ